MVVCIDLTPIYDHLTGIERYNINISREMIKNHTENKYILIFKNEVHPLFEQISKQDNVQSIILAECNKLFFIQFRLLRALYKIEADYYLFLSFTSPILFKKGKIVNAIHDLTCWDCPESMPSKMVNYYRFTYKFAIKNSWRIVTVSRFSQHRICNTYRLPLEKVSVIYDGLTDIFIDEVKHENSLKQKYDLPTSYFLSLSTIEPRKNLKLLIRAYSGLLEEDIDLPDLVLAGRKGWKLEEIVPDIDTSIKEKIHFTGFVDDKDLPQIYREARLFVFPSKYEGFGLPLIEAMSQRVLVVTSDAASLPEVAGTACVYFKSDDVVSLKNALMQAFNMNNIERLKRIEDGYVISKSYSWSNEAEKLYQLLNENR